MGKPERLTIIDKWYKRNNDAVLNRLHPSCQESLISSWLLFLIRGKGSRTKDPWTTLSTKKGCILWLPFEESIERLNLLHLLFLCVSAGKLQFPFWREHRLCFDRFQCPFQDWTLPYVIRDSDLLLKTILFMLHSIFSFGPSFFFPLFTSSDEAFVWLDFLTMMRPQSSWKNQRSRVYDTSESRRRIPLHCLFWNTSLYCAKFYVWNQNGSNNKQTRSQLDTKAVSTWKINSTRIFFSDKIFPSSWSHRHVPVIFFILPKNHHSS